MHFEPGGEHCRLRDRNGLGEGVAEARGKPQRDSGADDADRSGGTARLQPVPGLSDDPATEHAGEHDGRDEIAGARHSIDGEGYERRCRAEHRDDEHVVEPPTPGLRAGPGSLSVAADQTPHQVRHCHQRAGDDQKSTHDVNILQDARDPLGVEPVRQADETCSVAQHVSQVHEHLARSRERNPVNGLERAHRSSEPTDQPAGDDCCDRRSDRRDARPPLPLSQHGDDARAEHRHDAISDHQEVTEHSEGEHGNRRCPSPVEAASPQSGEGEKSQDGRADMVRTAEQEGRHRIGGKRQQRHDSASSGQRRGLSLPPAGDKGTDHDGDRNRNSWFQIEQAGPKTTGTHCQRVEERVGRPERVARQDPAV